MPGATFLFIAAVFVLAGFVKGVVGLGLPTISMGLLALVMPPVEAAAVLVLPSLLTNVWQMLDGSSLKAIVRRLWPMMLAVCAGTWAGAGLMTGAYASYMTGLLGVTLVLYALSGFTAVSFTIAKQREGWIGALVGAITGLVTAATGVFVIPAVPYLQTIGLEKDDLVQALGLSFTVSTLALAVNVAQAGRHQPRRCRCDVGRRRRGRCRHVDRSASAGAASSGAVPAVLFCRASVLGSLFDRGRVALTVSGVEVPAPALRQRAPVEFAALGLRQ